MGTLFGYLGLTLFSAYALVPSLTVRTSQSLYEFLTALRVRMVDILIDGFKAYGEARLVKTDSPGYKLRRPALFP